MSKQSSKDVITKIEDDLKNVLSDEKLKYAMDFITHLTEIGNTTVPIEYPFHYASHYKDVLTCLVVCWKDENADHYNLAFCCWPGELDVIENDNFPVDERLKEFARANVKYCFKCGGCEIEPSVRMVFGEKHDNVCSQVFHFWQLNNETVENAKILMELLKYIIDDK